MAYSPPIAYSPPMAYATPPPSYAPPSYGTPSSYGSPPIPLAPLVVPEDPLDPSAGGGGGGGGGMVTSFFALPLIVVLPLLVPVIGLALVVGAGGGGGGGGGGKLKKALSNLLIKLGKKKNQKLSRTVAGAENDETPYYNEQRNGDDYQDADNRKPNHSDQNRHRRQAENKKNIPATSSALPSMSVAQVERLTQVVYAALNSQECIQRLLCELGSLSRSFSDTTRTVTKAVEEYVPDKLKDSFNVFAKAEKCEQFQCGSLKVKK